MLYEYFLDSFFNNFSIHFSIMLLEKLNAKFQINTYILNIVYIRSQGKKCSMRYVLR